MNMERNIVTLRKVEVLRKDNMEEDALFLEEEEEAEEVKLNVMPMERKGTCLANAQRRIKKIEKEKHTFLKQKVMWKQKQWKEERTS
jgi:hypothetical protein